MILVTGGTGLLGSHLLYELAKQGKKVRAIYRSKEKINEIKYVFDIYNESKNDLFSQIEWLHADILNLAKLNEIFPEVDEVYHCAAMVSFNPDDKGKMMQNNITGTANMVNMALKHNVKSFCHVSSIATLGKQENAEVDENSEFNLNGQNTNYARSKYYSELEVWRGIAEGLNAYIVNPSVILGPGFWNAGIGSLFRKIENGLKYYSPGKTGYIDVRDVVKIMILLNNPKMFNQRYILSAQNNDYKFIFSSIADFIESKAPSIEVSKLMAAFAWRIEKIRCKFTGKAPLITRESMRTSFGKKEYSNKKITELLNYDFISITESLANISKHYIAHTK